MDIKAIGIDVGYLYARFVAVDSQGRALASDCRLHKGDIRNYVLARMAEIGVGDSVPVVLSGKEIRPWSTNHPDSWQHEAQALVVAARHSKKGIRAILHVGASGVSLIEMDDEGNLTSYVTNTLCAAGTGSFLDEQAQRLGISYQERLELPESTSIPTIATRCTVFAKSDLIHRQQEGFSREAMWAGLCKGMTSTLFQTLLKGRELPSPCVLTGGVSLNPFVIHFAQERYPGSIHSFPDGHLAVAMGGAIIALERGSLLDVGGLKKILATQQKASSGHERRPPLLLVKSRYPSGAGQEEDLDEHQSEIRITDLPRQANLKGSLGIDVGSTSTKLAVVDPEGRVLCDVYRKTAGEPFEATRLVLKAFKKLLDERKTAF